MTPGVLFGRLLAKARLRHLHLLLRIAELESLQKAATAIHMSQPGATHALAELEAILELPLFERHARGMRPTAICSALLPMVRSSFAQLQMATETMAAMQNGATGHLRIAGISAAMSSLLARVLPSFTEQHPEVSVNAHPAAANNLLQLMEEREADILVCREPPALPDHLTFLPFEEDRYVVASKPSHPLAQTAMATKEELAQSTWLLPPPFGIAAKEFEHLTEALGATPKASWVTSKSILLTLAMLQERELLVLIPRNAIVQLLGAGLLTEIACPSEVTSPLAPIGLLFAKSAQKQNPPTASFIAHAQHVYQLGDSATKRGDS